MSSEQFVFKSNPSANLFAAGPKSPSLNSAITMLLLHFPEEMKRGHSRGKNEPHIATR